jgi:WhiB family redox-sensing transcriptional regulator
MHDDGAKPDGPAGPGTSTSGSSSERAWEWMDQGLCTKARTTQFFPDRGQRAGPAKAVCERCRVRRPCLLYAVENQIVDGIWGGLSAQERTAVVVALRRSTGSPGSPG